VDVVAEAVVALAVVVVAVVASEHSVQQQRMWFVRE
jgi:hypothetical protein